jgi:hypothetical protein
LKAAADEARRHPEFAREYLAGAKQAAEKLGILVEDGERGPSAAKAGIDSAGFTRGLKPPSPSDVSFSAACKAPVSIGYFWRA